MPDNEDSIMSELLGPILSELSALRTDLRSDISSVRDQLQAYHEADNKAREDMLIRIDRLERWKEEHEAIETTQADRIAQLENPDTTEHKWAQRHPVLAEGAKYIMLIVIFCVLAYFLPGVAKLIGSI
jgi:hypothetical protein